MTNEERRLLTDSHILAQFQRGDAVHDAIEKDVAQNREKLAVLVSELTSFRSEAREQFTQSRTDRDALKGALEQAQRDTREQFVGVSECIGDLKDWQVDADRMAEVDKEQRKTRQVSQDKVFEEIVAEFQFRRQFGKWRNSFLVSIGVIFGVIVSGHSVWELVKQLFDHPQP